MIGPCLNCSSWKVLEPSLIAPYGEDKVASLLADPGIVRNRAKVAATVQNA